MITKQEYLNALEIVEAYHIQLAQKISPIKLTPIMQWSELTVCSVRLRNILRDIRIGNMRSRDYKEDFIENIQINEMRRARGCGSKTVNEFIELRGY
jgi:hypothetical protein